MTCPYIYPLRDLRASPVNISNPNSNPNAATLR